MQLFGEILGWINTVITGVRSVPQIVRIVKNKSGEDISLWTNLFVITYSVFWVIHGALVIDLQVSITSSILLLCAIIIISVKFYYKKWYYKVSRNKLETKYVDLLIKKLK